MLPNAVMVKVTGLPSKKAFVLKHVMALVAEVAVAVVVTNGRETLSIGGDGYPLINPD